MWRGLRKAHWLTRLDCCLTCSVRLPRPRLGAPAPQSFTRRGITHDCA